MSGVVPIPIRRGREPWLTKRQVAQHFGVSERTIERWTADGMPARRPPRGRLVRYVLSECEDWLAGGAPA